MSRVADLDVSENAVKGGVSSSKVLVESVQSRRANHDARVKTRVEKRLRDHLGTSFCYQVECTHFGDKILKHTNVHRNCEGRDSEEGQSGS